MILSPFDGSASCAGGGGHAQDTLQTFDKSPVQTRFGRWIGERFFSGLMYPTAVLLRGEHTVFRALKELEARQWESAESLDAGQREKLAAIVQYGLKRSPFYSNYRHLADGLRSTNVRDVLQQLRPLTKEDVQQNLSTLCAQAFAGRVTRKTTGGSTGEPVTVIKDRPAIAREMAASWLAYGWFGVERGNRGVRFWGSPHTKKRELRFRAADLAMHRIRFSAFDFDDAQLAGYWKRCLEFRPLYFYGYVSMIDAFATYLDRERLDGRALGLKAVITTSEVLTATQRARIERVFGAPVQNEYGCGEVGPIAYECPRGKLHIMADNLYVEFLKPDGNSAEPGEAGEIVVTDLNNRAMPLLRYRLGDFGVPGGTCTCGRGWPVLESIWGRAYDFVETPEGRRHHGEYFMYLMEDLRAAGLPIRQFKVTQVSAGRLDVRVVAECSAADAVVRTVRAAFEERLHGMQVLVEQVASIPRAQSGKMQVIENRWESSSSLAKPVHPTIPAMNTKQGGVGG